MDQVINNPILPPRKGYVEVEINGVRTYRNIETETLIDDEIQKLDSLTETQLAIAELAEAQEAYQTANELALAELADLITGGVS